MFGDEAPAESGSSASPRTTIVGGRPPEPSVGLPPVPTGIERLLRLAAVDQAFRQVLVERRGAAAEAAGFELTPNEGAILTAIPANQLVAMAESLPAPAQPRRQFLQQAAASAVLALGGAALANCADCDPTRGIRSDVPQRPEHNEMQETGGAAPDIPPEPESPPPRPEYNVMDEAGGAAPDIPPEPQPPPRPDHNEMQREGGVAPHRPPPRPPEKHLTRGITHDLPPPRPEHSETQLLGGALSDEPEKS
jgi:hypothetical protein